MASQSPVGPIPIPPIPAPTAQHRVIDMRTPADIEAQRNNFSGWAHGSNAEVGEALLPAFGALGAITAVVGLVKHPLARRFGIAGAVAGIIGLTAGAVWLKHRRETRAYPHEVTVVGSGFTSIADAIVAARELKANVGIGRNTNGSFFDFVDPVNPDLMFATGINADGHAYQRYDLLALPEWEGPDVIPDSTADTSVHLLSDTQLAQAFPPSAARTLHQDASGKLVRGALSAAASGSVLASKAQTVEVDGHSFSWAPADGTAASGTVAQVAARDESDVRSNHADAWGIVSNVAGELASVKLAPASTFDPSAAANSAQTGDTTLVGFVGEEGVFLRGGGSQPQPTGS